jgi:hypothetical protein
MFGFSMKWSFFDLFMDFNCGATGHLGLLYLMNKRELNILKVNNGDSLLT